MVPNKKMFFSLCIIKRDVCDKTWESSARQILQYTSQNGMKGPRRIIENDAEHQD